jgi:hypothetical protein
VNDACVKELCTSTCAACFLSLDIVRRCCFLGWIFGSTLNTCFMTPLLTPCKTIEDHAKISWLFLRNCINLASSTSSRPCLWIELYPGHLLTRVLSWYAQLEILFPYDRTPLGFCWFSFMVCAFFVPCKVLSSHLWASSWLHRTERMPPVVGIFMHKYDWWMTIANLLIMFRPKMALNG